MCNFDSFGSALGWAEFTVNATDALRGKLKEIFYGKKLFFRENTAPVPYTDQFPFAACGVPGIWIFRQNCAAGLFYHHRSDNTPDKIDFQISADHVKAAAELMDFLADTGDLSAYRGIPPEMQQEIDTLFQQVFGGF